METIEMTEAQRSAIQEVLLYKRERLKFSLQMLELRQIQATKKLQELVKLNTQMSNELIQMEAAFAALREGINKEQTATYMQKLAFKIHQLKSQMEPLLVKVLFDLPLALEKAQMQVIENFLNDDLRKGYET
jgi:hypothetical protein